MRFVQVDRLERGFCYSYGMLCDSSDTNDALGMYFKCILFMIIQDVFFFFFFFLGGKDIHYTSAMIATSRVCDVHHKPERPQLTTHLEILRHES